MHRLGSSLVALHVLSLCLWGASVLSAGLAAAIAFPTMKALDPRLPAYARYDGDHWMLAAGTIANRVFEVTDVVQMVTAAVAVATAIALMAIRVCAGRSMATLVWLGAVAVAAGVLGYTLIVLRPGMAVDLHAYWDAALAGNTPAAEAARQEFSGEHPTASNLMAATAGAVLVAIIAVIPAAGIGKRGHCAAKGEAPGGSVRGPV